MIGVPTENGKPKPPLSLDNYDEEPKDSSTTVDTSRDYAVYVPGPTSVPNQGPGQSWYSSPRPTSLTYDNAQQAQNAGYGNLDGVYGTGAKNWLDTIAKAIDYRSTGKGLWQMALDALADPNYNGPRLTPMQWVEQYAQSMGVDPGTGESPTPPGGGGGGGGGGAGAYTGPRTSTSISNAPAFDVRSIADAVSMEMLGRGVEQDEMERILKRVRKYEANNPSVTVSQAGTASSTSQSKGGVSSAGYQQVIEKMIAKNPEFGDYQAATKVMGWFDDWLARRGQAVG